MENNAINRKEVVIHNVLAAMGTEMECVQLQMLENALRESLKGLTLGEECTALSTELDDNEKMVSIFLASKKLEGLKHLTLVQYRTTAYQLFDYIQKNYRDISKNDIKIYLAWRMQNVKLTTLQNTKSNLSSFFGWLHREGYISSNPVPDGAIKVPELENIHLTPDEEVKVRDVPKTLKEAAVVDFLLSTGVRIGELEAMNIQDIDFGAGTCTFQGEKGSRSYRTVILDAAAQQHLIAYLNTRKDCNPALFVTDRDYNGVPKRMGKAGLEKITKTVGERAGLQKRLTVHVFRRTLATRLADHGCPLEVIQQLLGHKKAETTQRYIAQSKARIVNHATKYFNKAA